jgi:hypothetical protein
MPEGMEQDKLVCNHIRPGREVGDKILGWSMSDEHRHSSGKFTRGRSDLPSLVLPSRAGVGQMRDLFADSIAQVVQDDCPEIEATAGATVADFSAADSPPPDDLSPDDLPAWEDLPADWKSRFGLNPSLGRWEYAQSVKREQKRKRRVAAAPRSSQRERYDFRHPAMSDPKVPPSL